MTGIIDYDAGNIASVIKAFEFLGEETLLTGDASALLKADRVVLPGVGSFGDAMEELRERGLVEVIHKIVEKGIPFIGICLGLQLLFESSEEAPGVAGLGLLPGRIVRFPENKGLKIPHIGWNQLEFKGESSLFKGLKNGSFVYFVHSYYLEPSEESCVAAVTDYGVPFGSAVEKGNVYGCQFHPEKSSDVGLAILKNFLRR